MASEYYVVHDGDRWELLIPEDEYDGEGDFVLETFERKRPAMKRGRELAKNQNATLVENARAGYTMAHHSYDE
jgi:hypothetical protein